MVARTKKIKDWDISRRIDVEPPFEERQPAIIDLTDWFFRSAEIDVSIKSRTAFFYPENRYGRRVNSVVSRLFTADLFGRDHGGSVKYSWRRKEFFSYGDNRFCDSSNSSVIMNVRVVSHNTGFEKLGSWIYFMIIRFIMLKFLMIISCWMKVKTYKVVSLHS